MILVIAREMKASLLECVPSKSRERRRWRVIQALVRSTTHLQLPHMKASGHDLVPIDDRSFWCPHTSQAGPWVLDDLETHREVLLHPVLERFPSIPAIPPDHLETRQASDQSREQYHT